MNKNILIITDGSTKTNELAAEIKTALKGNKVITKDASEFQGTDLLPSEVFFLGCEMPEPNSFAYVADLFKHINLAGRPCGVFSPDSKKAAKYLAGLLKDSEAALNPQHLSSSTDVGSWAKSVISQTA